MSEVEKMEIADIAEASKDIDTKAIAEEILSWLHNNVENYVDNQMKLYKIDLVIDSDEMPMTKKLQDLYSAIPEDEAEDDGAPKLLEELELPSQEGEGNEIVTSWGDASDCRRELDKVVERAYDEIQNNHDKSNDLFKRLIFFYEKIIMNPENRKRALLIDEELKALFESKEGASKEEQKEIQKKVVKLIEEGEHLVKWEEFEGAVSITKFDYEAFSVGVSLSSKPTEEEIEMGAKSEVMKEYTIPEGFVIWMEMNYRLKARPTVMF
jgi:hypothetical protein